MLIAFLYTDIESVRCFLFSVFLIQVGNALHTQAIDHQPYSSTGRYHTVTCLDVMIHYPQDRVDGMIRHLGSLAEERLIISFAPKTLAYSILKRIGELFPGPSKVC